MCPGPAHHFFRTSRLILRCSFALALLCGCDRDRKAPLVVLDNVDSYELMSLDPDDAQATDLNTSFHGYLILGRTPINNAATQQKLNDALRAAVRDSSGRGMACFNPRHGVRVTRGGVTTDLVICFECEQALVYTGSTKSPTLFLAGTAQPTFDSVLKGAGVPLPKPAR